MCVIPNHISDGGEPQLSDVRLWASGEHENLSPGRYAHAQSHTYAKLIRIGFSGILLHCTGVENIVLI